jgi:hypothetical protein
MWGIWLGAALMVMMSVTLIFISDSEDRNIPANMATLMFLGYGLISGACLMPVASLGVVRLVRRNTLLPRLAWPLLVIFVILGMVQIFMLILPMARLTPALDFNTPLADQDGGPLHSLLHKASVYVHWLNVLVLVVWARTFPPAAVVPTATEEVEPA